MRVLRNRRRHFLRQMGTLAALGGSALAAGCAQRSIHAADTALEPIADDPIDTSPENQAATLRNIDRLLPTRDIHRGITAVPLLRHERDLAATAIPYEYRGTRYTLDDYLRRNRVSGILVLKSGRVALERYAMGNGPKSLWTTFSVAKSVTSTLVGCAIRDGSIASLDDRVTRYVPALRDSVWDDCSIRHLMTMTSGVQWSEDFSVLHGSDLLRFVHAIESRTSGALMDLMRTRDRAAEPGAVFNYSTGDSYVLGAVVAGATGENLSAYLSRKIWAPLGMERDAYWLLDAPGGLETGGDNISACLRDYGRFGLFFLDRGRAGSPDILPPGWRDLATRPQTAVAAYGQVDEEPLGFGYQWWSFPVGAGALPFHDGAFTAQGIYGQFLYVNPQEDVVAVVWSAWRSPWDDNAEMETYALLGAAVHLLQERRKS
jgi:CubicO group peptidase (beta-lactamase class C family)